MKKSVDIAIIGCGIFGAEIALKASSLGLSVQVFESKHDILLGASMNNQNRLHLGFHYPRDIQTGLQSIRGFDSFKKKYQACIQDNFLNTYFISKNNSLTTRDQYLSFCKELGVSFEEIKPAQMPIQVKDVNGGISCKEVVYDCNILREIVRDNLADFKIDVALSTTVESLKRENDFFSICLSTGDKIKANLVINASYGSSNHLTEQLGIKIPERQYEYTAVPIIKLDIKKIGITIMDGPFITLLPYGKTDNFLLYHVESSVVTREYKTKLNPEWLSKETSPLNILDKDKFFKNMVDNCINFIPVLKTAELLDILEGPRMIQPGVEDTDARPSLITNYDNYIEVFSGKIDHSIWVADEVGKTLTRKFEK